MRKKTVLFIFSLGVFVCFFSSCEKDEPPVLTTTPSIGMYIENGLIMKDGKPFYGVGANYFNLFNKIVESNDQSGSTTDGLIKLAQAGIPFVRFAACPYSAKGWAVAYQKDTAAYFKNFDKVVKIAEKYKIGLVPSLFWHTPAVPDFMGEHMDQYANEQSKTIAFIMQYTREIVRRYKNSPAIWGWEFGNEFANVIDIPHKYLADINPSQGTPTTRDSLRDFFTLADMRIAFRAFGNTVREYDTKRPIFSGNTEPRASAFHNNNDITTDDWQLDSESEYKRMVSLYESDPINTLTVRGYYNFGTSSNSYPLGNKSVSAFFSKMKQWSDEFNKPLFVGEFGATSKTAFMERLNAIVSNRIQMSAFWAYDNDNGEGEYSISFTNSQKSLLTEVIKANEEMKNF